MGGWAGLRPAEVGKEHFTHKVLANPGSRYVLLLVSSGIVCKPNHPFLRTSTTKSEMDSVTRFAPQTSVVLGVV